MENTKKIDWYTLAFMAFSTVWGFGNVLNGFVYFNGVQVIFSWVLMFALYFVPYALMVGELGSAFKQSGGGVSSWIHETIGPKCAYYAGWTYWACHVTYIASKGSGGHIPDDRCTDGNTRCLPVLLLGCKPRLKPVKEISDDRWFQYVRNVHPVHLNDVRSTGHQPERRFRIC